MQTKNYVTQLIPLIRAVCGVEFANVELPRIHAMVNRRADRAYMASDWWPRFLVVGEERAVSNNVVPYTETDLANIDTFLRIHRTQPFVSASVQEFDFTVDVNGAKLVAGSLNPTSAWVTYKTQLNTVYGDGTNSTSTSVPAEWFEYIAHGVYADYLRSNGQIEQAQMAEVYARDLLVDQLEKVDKMLTIQTAGNRVRTNSNMQIR